MTTFVRQLTVIVIFVALYAGSGLATEINGVFGLVPVPDGTSLAVWIPLDSDESIAGCSWYNNDGSTVFPRILAVAGSGDPVPLDDALVVGENVSGGTLAWSEWQFANPIASATPGLYLVFSLPAEDEFLMEGVGPGLGYQYGNGDKRCWVVTQEGAWGLLDPGYKMAVAPIMNNDKSGNVIVLGGKAHDSDRESGSGDSEIPQVASLGVAPNPFNPQTELKFALPLPSSVSLAIYDLKGRRVRTLVDGRFEAGFHSVVWNGRDDRNRGLPSGVYISLFKAGSIRLTRRVTMVQ